MEKYKCPECGSDDYSDVDIDVYICNKCGTVFAVTSLVSALKMILRDIHSYDRIHDDDICPHCGAKKFKEE